MLNLVPSPGKRANSTTKNLVLATALLFLRYDLCITCIFHLLYNWAYQRNTIFEIIIYLLNITDYVWNYLLTLVIEDVAKLSLKFLESESEAKNSLKNLILSR